MEPVTLEKSFEYHIPTDILQRLDVGEGESESDFLVELENGAPLPEWLKFDQQRRTLRVAHAPEHGLPMDVAIVAGGKRIVVRLAESESVLSP